MFINVQTKIEGVHRWENAPDKVSFLRNLHRHLFNVSVKLEVTHNDRDIEFFILKNDIENFFENNYPKFHPEMIRLFNFDKLSCEHISEDLRIFIKDKYKKEKVEIEIREDEENSGVLSTL
jgi:hypothetical protein